MVPHPRPVTRVSRSQPHYTLPKAPRQAANLLDALQIVTYRTPKFVPALGSGPPPRHREEVGCENGTHHAPPRTRAPDPGAVWRHGVGSRADAVLYFLGGSLVWAARWRPRGAACNPSAARHAGSQPDSAVSAGAAPRPNTSPFWRARAGNAPPETASQPSRQGPRPLAGSPPRGLA